MAELSRRQFAALVGLAGAYASASEPAAVGQDKATEKNASQPADDMTSAEHALRMLLARYPDERLNAAAQVSLLVDLERHMSRSKTLGAVELENGDEPGFAFRAVLRQERKA